MSIPLDQPSSSATVRKPGDFKRKGTDGPPYVKSLTKTRQPQGKKAELLEQCKARGLAVPDKVTVPELKELLGPEPAWDLYGRPSGYGELIDDSWNLIKWKERGVALGIAMEPSLLHELHDVADDEQAERNALDRIVNQAHDVAGSDIGALRGTWAHSICDWADVDPYEELPRELYPDPRFEVTVDQAVQIARRWHDLIVAADLEILATEQSIVNDELRLAGTLDRIVSLGRDLTIGGVTIPAGTVLVLDIKTSKLHADGEGLPSYWDSYPIQIAVYAGSTPYDCDTDERGTWDDPIDQRHALIAHLDVEHLIETGEVRWSLIYVDLEVGRQGIAAVQAAQAYHAAPKFAVTSSAGGDDEAATSSSQPDVEPEEATRSASSAPSNRRDALRARKVAMETDAIKTGWHPRFLAEWAAHGITSDSTDDEIEAALDAIEPPFDPDPAPPHGIERPTAAPVTRPATVSPAEVARMLEAIAESDYRAVVNAWLAQANTARCSFDPRGNHLEVNHARTHAAYELARATDGDDEYARLILGHVLAGAAQPAVEVGVAIGHLSVEDARQAIALAKAFGDSVALIFAEDGSPRLDGPIAAVLAAA